MTHAISNFKSALTGGGARSNLFQVNINRPTGVGGVNALNASQLLLCKATNLPASNVASIDVPFRGRIFKVAGDRTFDNWSVTIINDTDFTIRRFMEDWMQYIAQYADGSGRNNPADYMTNATVSQLNRQASTLNAVSNAGLSVVKTYTFIDIFPVNISAIDLSYDSSDTIEEFSVEFAVQYWYPDVVAATTAAT